MGVPVTGVLDCGDELPALRAESIEPALERGAGDIGNVEVHALVLPSHEASRCKREAWEPTPLRREDPSTTVVRSRASARPLPLRNSARNLAEPGALRMEADGHPFLFLPFSLDE